VAEVMDLGFGKCSLQVQVPANGGVERVEDLVGRNIVSSFTALTEKYFRGLEEGAEGVNGVKKGEEVEGGEKRGLKTQIKFVGGSVEAACALGVADGIVDLVGTSCRLFLSTANFQFFLSPYSSTPQKKNTHQLTYIPPHPQNPAKRCAPPASAQSPQS